MSPPEEATPIRRSNWRSAMAWITASRSRTVFVVALFLAAGSFSALGLLRWQAPFARWSFGLLCWGLAVVVWRARTSRGGE